MMETLPAFRNLGLSEMTLQVLQKRGFEEPTPIQREAIPALLTTKADIIGQAQTGTGKTAAFALPILEKLDEESRLVQALILAPTRELAVQVSDECNALKGPRRLSIIPVYGGQSIQEQIRHLKKGAQIVVGTPGRILDHLRRKTLRLDHLAFIVLDEADEMLNMGFIDEVDEILAQCNADRQIALFSATMPERIEHLAKKYMKETRRIAVKKQQITTDLTDQIYFEVQQRDKFEALCRIIDVEDVFYGLVFCRTKNDVDEVTAKLGARGYDAEAIHGDISQKQREQVLAKFKNRMINILVATDVAARGLDISNLTHVINFALPHDPEAYVHRIGRTGRAGQHGVAITFITPAEYRKLAFIQRITKSAIRREQVPEIEEILRIKHAQVGGEIEASMSRDDLDMHQKMAHTLMSKYPPEKLVKALLGLVMQDRVDASRYQAIAAPTSPDVQGKTRLMIGIGTRDGYRPKGLVEFIKKQTGLKDHLIDDVSVRETFSFITVPFRDAERIVKQSANATRQGSQPLIVKAEDKRSHGKPGKTDDRPVRKARPEKPERAAYVPKYGIPVGKAEGKHGHGKESKADDRPFRKARPERPERAAYVPKYGIPVGKAEGKRGTGKESKADDRPFRKARPERPEREAYAPKYGTPMQEKKSKKDKDRKKDKKPKKDKKGKKDKKRKDKGKRKLKNKA